MSRPSRWLMAAAFLAVSSRSYPCQVKQEAQYQVLQRLPHDSTAYTEGLAQCGDFLFESTGLNGHSELRVVDRRNGNVIRRARLSRQDFGEGIAVLHGMIYQLTWHSGKAFVYQVPSLALVDSLPYHGEGWGLATDGTNLIVSTGSDTLLVIDPATFVVRRRISVRSKGARVRSLNELEFAHGDIFANIRGADSIAQIDAATGEVRQWIDFTGLVDREVRAERGELNGISYDDCRGVFLVTGKYWPDMYEVRLRMAERTTLPRSGDGNRGQPPAVERTKKSVCRCR